MKRKNTFKKLANSILTVAILCGALALPGFSYDGWTNVVPDYAAPYVLDFDGKSENASYMFWATPEMIGRTIDGRFAVSSPDTVLTGVTGDAVTRVGTSGAFRMGPLEESNTLQATGQKVTRPTFGDFQKLAESPPPATIGLSAPRPAGIPLKMVKADLNGDGLLDLVVLDRELVDAGKNRLTVYFNENGNFPDNLANTENIMAPLSPQGTVEIHDFDIIDYNNDQSPDIVMVRETSDGQWSLAFYFNDLIMIGPGPLTALTIPDKQAIFKFKKQGNTNRLFVATAEQSVVVFDIGPDGTLAESGFYPLNPICPAGSNATIDGDCHSDSGQSFPAISFNGLPGQMEVEDLDGDGRDEIYLFSAIQTDMLSRSGGAPRGIVYLANKDDGTLVSQFTTLDKAGATTAIERAASIQFEDVTGDGLKDILINHGPSLESPLLFTVVKNTGGPIETFNELVGNLPNHSDASSTKIAVASATCDFNKDSTADIVTIEHAGDATNNSEQFSIVVYPGNGADAFTVPFATLEPLTSKPASMPLGPPTPLSRIVCGDFTGDNNSDIVYHLWFADYAGQQNYSFIGLGKNTTGPPNNGLSSCQAPGPLSVPPTSSGHIALQWGGTNDGCTYTVEQSRDGEPYQVVGSSTGTTATYTATVNGSYAFRVKAVKPGYADSAYSVGGNTCSVMFPLSAPTSIIVPADNNDGRIFVRWNEINTTGSSYTLEQSHNGGPFVPIYTGRDIYTYAAVSANGTYQYRVKAVKTGYADSSYLTGSACTVYLMCGAPPSITVPSTNADGRPFILWSSSNIHGATYILERSQNGGAFAEVYRGQDLYAYVNTTSSGMYAYRVKSVKSGYVDSGYTTGTTSCSVTLPVTAPLRITAPVSNTDGTMFVYWDNSVPGGVTYTVEQSYNGGTYTQVYSGTNNYFYATATANGSYTFRVKAAKTGYADSGYTQSNTCTVSLVMGAPPRVTAPTTNADGRIYVYWNSSTPYGGTYTLEQSFNGSPYTLVYSGTSNYFYATATANGSYTFRVKASKTGYADSGYTQSGTCAVSLAMSTPSRITAPVTNADGRVFVYWTTSTPSGATYVVEQSYNGGPYTQVYSGTSSSFYAPAPANGSYTYRVKATKTGYTTSGYVQSNVCTVTLAMSAPSRVIVPATNADGRIFVYWNSSNPSGGTYTVEQSYNGSPYTQVYTGTGSSFYALAIANGTYTYRVKAAKTGYATSGYTQSNVCTVTLAMSAPSRVTAPATNNDGQIFVYWNNNNPSTGTYTVEQSYNGGAYTKVYVGASTSSYATATANGSYTFRVKAEKPGYISSGYTQSNPCLVTLAMTAPSHISVPATNAAGRIFVYWNSSTPSGGTYTVEQSFNGGAYTQVYNGTSTSFYANATTGGSYTYRVKASKPGYADSGYTQSTACNVSLAMTAPSRMTVPASNADGRPFIYWDSSTPSGGTYTVEQSFNGGAYIPVYNGPSTYFYGNTPDSGSYTYRVKASKPGYADSSYTQSTACNVSLAVTAPPRMTVPASNADGKPFIYWDSSTPYSGVTYTVEQSFNGGAYAQVYSGPITYFYGNTPNSGSYTYRVKASKPGYADSGYTQSTTCNVSLAVAAPPRITVPRTNADGKPFIYWDSSPPYSGVTYTVEQSFNGGAYTQAYSGSSTYFYGNAPDSGSYTYRVKASKPGYATSGYTQSTTCSVSR